MFCELCFFNNTSDFVKLFCRSVGMLIPWALFWFIFVNDYTWHPITNLPWPTPPRRTTNSIVMFQYASMVCGIYSLWTVPLVVRASVQKQHWHQSQFELSGLIATLRSDRKKGLLGLRLRLCLWHVCISSLAIVVQFRLSQLFFECAFCCLCPVAGVWCNARWHFAIAIHITVSRRFTVWFYLMNEVTTCQKCNTTIIS